MHVTESRHRFLVSMSRREMDLVRRLVDLGLDHQHVAAVLVEPLAAATAKAALDRDFAASLDGGDRRNLNKWEGNPLRQVDSLRTNFNERTLPQAANALRARRRAAATHDE
jgi:hypothetical protein